MSIFDMGKNVDDYKIGVDVGIDKDYTAYLWHCFSSWCILAGKFYGDRSSYLFKVNEDVSSLPGLGISKDDVQNAVVFLERTALELRKMIAD